MSYCICVKKLRKNIEKSARKIWSVRKNAYLCNPKRKERYFTELQVRKILGAIAQLVEQRTENPCVPSSILGGTTENPRRCILRGFKFLILLHLRFVRPRVRGSPGPPNVSCVLALSKYEEFKKKFNTFEVVGHLALPEVGAVLVAPDGLEHQVSARGWM